MTAGFIIAGTSTGIGKTVFAAALVQVLGAHYWKPVQSGLEGETDSEVVARLAGVARDRIVPEAYRLALPASPHIAARREGIEIAADRLGLPRGGRPLVVETAGGLLVPLSMRLPQIDMIKRWQLPVILCAATTLGTINHTLLSLEALRARTIPVHGVAFIGEASDEAEQTIAELGRVRRLGRLPHLDQLTPTALASSFAASFKLVDFATAA
jgi:dethiobiotin synthetase